MAGVKHGTGLIGLIAIGCATTPPLVPASSVDSSADLGRFDLTELALLVSGYEAHGALQSTRGRFEALVEPIVRRLQTIESDEVRGRELLRALHAKDGPLVKYETRSTTLMEVIDHGHYNCLSSSVLYLLLARRLRLNVRAQLLPTHARVLVDLDRPVVVETTSPFGFDPDPQALAEILAQVAGSRTDRARALVPDAGAAVSEMVLIGAMYVNRASIAQEAGDLELAERLFGRGEALATRDSMKQVLRDQRAALLSQLAADDINSNVTKRIERAYQTMQSAAGLQPADPPVRVAVQQNLRAAAERLVARRAAAKDEAAVQAIVNEASAALDPDDAAGLAAFAMSEVARLLVERGDMEGALLAIDSALGRTLAPSDAHLKKTLEQNQIAALRLAAMTSARRGDYGKSIKMIERLQRIAEREVYTEDHRRVIHVVAQKRVADDDLDSAAKLYREGRRLFPGDAAMRHNLIAVLERVALPLMEAGQCARVEDVLSEIASLDAAAGFVRKARLRCLMLRANERLSHGDHAEAVGLLEAAREHDPDAPLVITNLGLAMLSWAQTKASANDCDGARALAKKIRALASTPVSSARLRRSLGRCAQ